MGKTLIKVVCTDQRLALTMAPRVASGGQNEDLIEFEFCPLWNGFAKTAIFYRKLPEVYNVEVVEDKCVIPHEVLETEGLMYFGVFGTKGDATRTSEIISYRVVRGALTSGVPSGGPTPNIFEQIKTLQSSISTMQNDVGALQHTADRLSEEIAEIDQAVAEVEESTDELAGVLGTSPSRNLNVTRYESQTKNGVTFAVNKDNSITINGTTTTDTYAANSNDRSIHLMPGTYYFSGSGSWTTYRVYPNFWDKEGNKLNLFSTGIPLQGSFTIDVEAFGYMEVCCQPNAQFDNVVVKPQLEKGMIATEYQSPWGGDNRLDMIEKEIDELRSKVDGGEVPEYYNVDDYLANKAARINELGASCAGNGDVFAFITDQHMSLNAGHSTALLAHLTRNCRIPRIFCGGDVDDLVNEEYALGIEASTQSRVHHVVGNHDIFFPETDNSIAYWYNSGKPEQVGNAERNYYYVDNAQQKIRYIVLSGFQTGGPDNWTWSWGYEAEQLAWLTDAALDVEAGWTIIVFTHLIYNLTENGAFIIDTHAQPVLNALDAYNGAGEIAAVICGHTHKDAIGQTSGGIPIVVTTCDKFAPWVSDGVDNEPWLSNRVEGTITEQAFDVAVLDKTNKQITFVRIGAPAENWISGATEAGVEERTVSY